MRKPACSERNTPVLQFVNAQFRKSFSFLERLG